MTKKTKIYIGVMILTIVLGAVAFFGWWGWKYYRLPSLPDTRDYKTIEERAESALAFAKSKHMNTHYALFLDYGVPSGTPRLYVWDFETQKIIARAYVMHGPGKGSTAKTPVFSNEFGSNCSALGRFLVTKQHGSSLKRSFRLQGMDIDNQSALPRGLMIHSSSWVDGHCWMKYIPLHSASCQGCVTVSRNGMDYLWDLINSERKPLLLWNYCTKKR